MLFSSLPQDLQDKLGATGLYLVMFSADVNVPRGTVCQATRLPTADDATLQQLVNYKGYTIGTAQEWFEFSTAPESDEDAIKSAQQALLTP